MALDVEWVKDDEVVKYRPGLPRHTVQNLKNLERWEYIGDI